MKRFCVHVEFSKNSILGSISRSSTIFGGLCWAIRECESESDLLKLLDLVEKGNALIISDLHPKDVFMIPFNVLQPTDSTDKTQKKRWKKAKYCKEDTKIIDQNHIDQWIKSNSILFSESDFFHQKYITRNAIKRDENVDENRTTPYSMKAYSLRKEKLEFEIIVDSSCFDAAQLKKYFSYLKIAGIGKKTSIGLGLIKNIKVKELEFSFNVQKKDIMALASFIPKPEDPYKGYYQLTTSPSRGLDGQIYPKITRVQARSVFFHQSQANMSTFLGRCLRVANKRLVYGLSPIQHIDMEHKS